MARAPGSIRDHHNHTTPPDCTPDSIQPKQLSQLGQPYEPISLIATLHGQLLNIPSTSQDPHRRTSYSKSSPAGHRSSQAPVCAVHQSWATPPAKSWTTSSKVPIEQDNSGTIERDEFLSLPQISSNPLATRYGKPTPTGLVV
ncbi:Calcineurin subunit B [Metarhizium anisopliae]|nr:Calcineurin subunit B [Metarhizium anisopliae]